MLDFIHVNCIRWMAVVVHYHTHYSQTVTHLRYPSVTLIYHRICLQCQNASRPQHINGVLWTWGKLDTVNSTRFGNPWRLQNFLAQHNSSPALGSHDTMPCCAMKVDSPSDSPEFIFLFYIFNQGLLSSKLLSSYSIQLYSLYSIINRVNDMVELNVPFTHHWNILIMPT